MDPLSVLASVEALADGAFKLVSFVNTIKEGGKQRLRLFTELNALWMVLKLLEGHLEPDGEELGEPWLSTIAALDEDNGVFDQIQAAFEDLNNRLRPKTGHRKILQTLRWPFDKSDVEALVAHLERLKSAVDLAMNSTSAAAIRALQGDTNAIKLSVADVKLKAILDWISSLNYLKQQNDFIKQTRNGTCQWFLERDDFREWLSTVETMLWCPGIPGAGKTFLASIVFGHLKMVHEGQNIAVLILYCGYNEAKSQSIDNLVAALIKQIVQIRPDVSKELKELYDHHSRTEIFPSLKDLTKVLRLELAKFDNCYIIVDGLDEILDESNRLALLETLTHGKVNIMVTSRPLDSIQEIFQSVEDISCDGCEEEHLRLIYHCKQCLGRGFDLCDTCYSQDLNCPQEGHYIVKRFGSYQVDVGATESDVRLYVEDRMDHEPRLMQNVSKRRALREEIASTIVEQSNGMFLLAKLHMDSLALKRTPKAVQEALQRLPTEIGDTYDQAMQRIEATNEEDRNIAMKFLLWITFAARPLSVREIEHACSIDAQTREIDPDEVLNAHDLTSMCSGLVMIDASDIVRLVHFSAQNYFYDNRERWFPGGEMVLTQGCLNYLSLKAFDAGPCFGPTENDEFATRSLQYPLLQYSCSYWGLHSRSTKQTDTITESTMSFLEHTRHLDSAVQALWYSDSPVVAGWDVKSGVLALHLAAYFGLTHVVSMLLAAGAAVNCRDSLATTPLMYAAAGGHAPVVQTLLTENADPNLVCDRGSSSLHRAIAFERIDVARTLLDHPDTNVNIVDSSRGDQTPLMLAAGLSLREIVAILVNKPELDINLQGGESQTTALHCAVESGSARNARMILSHPEIEVNKGNRWCTPLISAATSGYTSVVEALLDHGADTDLQEGADKASGTALNRAIDYGYTSVVRVLLDRGANPRVTDIYQRTVVHSAAVNGKDEVLRVLFERSTGVDINAQGTNGRTALHDAAYFDFCSTIKILIANGARTDIRDKAERSPLGVAKDRNNLSAVELLTKFRKEESARDQSMGPLRRSTTSVSSDEMGFLKAVKLGMTETIASYVARSRQDLSFDLNTSDLDQHTALHIAIQSRHSDILGLLIDAGANLNSIDRLQRTPLHWTILYDNTEAAERLLDAGASVSLEDHFEETALDISLSYRYYDLVALMLEHGAWPKTSKLQVALYAVAMHGTAALVKKLVDAGASPLHKDRYGQSPYHVAQDMENKEAAEMILSLCERPKQSSQDSTEDLDIAVRESRPALAS